MNGSELWPGASPGTVIAMGEARKQSHFRQVEFAAPPAAARKDGFAAAIQLLSFAVDTSPGL
jgi:hypothetical protein